MLIHEKNDAKHSDATVSLTVLQMELIPSIIFVKNSGNYIQLDLFLFFEPTSTLDSYFSICSDYVFTNLSKLQRKEYLKDIKIIF